MIDNLLQFLEWTDKKSDNKFYRYMKNSTLFIFYPVVILIELLVYQVLWKRIVKDICSDDELVGFLDENEFSIDRFRFVKKDLVTKKNPLFGKQEEVIEYELKQQFSAAISDLIRKNIISNIERYISIATNVKPYNSYIKIYTVSIVYYRIKILANRLFTFIISTLIFATIYGIIKYGILNLI